MGTIEIPLLILGTAALVFISRKSLMHPRSHGFYRFFAWEIILALFLLNVKAWFRSPFAWHQVISWMLLVFSLGMVILGVKQLREIGRHDTGRADPALLKLEKTSHLVTTGLYHYIRHPMYSSLLLLAWGIFFKLPSWLGSGLALLCTFFLIATARIEEHENISYFGAEYAAYMQRSKRFIPFFF